MIMLLTHQEELRRQLTQALHVRGHNVAILASRRYADGPGGCKARAGHLGPVFIGSQWGGKFETHT